MRPRPSTLRPVVFLALSSVALVLFIGITGDARRRSNAMERARLYATELAARTGPGKRLPLNLSPPGLDGSDPGALGMEWLDSSHAYVLRASHEVVLAAWTVPVVRAMGLDGRAVILFDRGRFSVRWMTLRQFARRHSQQAARIKSLAGRVAPQVP